jgi:hypothetical protein
MKISQALSQLTIFTYALAATTKLAMPAYDVPPAFDGYINTELIKTRETNLLTGTNLALEERGVESENIASRQGGIIVIIGVVVVLAIVVGVVTHIESVIEADDEVSNNSMLLVLLPLTMIRHSVVCHTLRGWSPTCIIMTPHSTMLYATHHILSHSMGPRARIGIICTTSWVYHLEGQ